MGLQKVAYNFIVERGGKFVKSLLCPAKPISSNASGLGTFESAVNKKGTRILFLSQKGFSNVFRKFKNKDFANICHYEITNNEKDLFSCYKTNVSRGHTAKIRTCTAGVCVNKGKSAPLFWHVENTKNNIENFPILSRLIKGTNAILIGSKSEYKYSKDLFEKFVEEMDTKKIPATIIQGTKQAEAKLIYESSNDTLYVCMNDIYKKDKYVKSMEDLQKTCDIVKISPSDSVEFYDILPKKSIKQRIKGYFHTFFK